jgi:hypothetical protein
MKNLQITEDWERESLKDFIYLHEQGQELDDTIQKELNKRQPAQIVVLDRDKILEKQHDYKHHTLPF